MGREAPKRMPARPALIAIQSEEWDRLRSETPKAWEAFVKYRDLGYERTLKKVAQELKKSVQLIGRWSLEFSWKSRVRAWDVYQDKMAQAETIRERVRARKSALEMARKMSDLALSGLNNLPAVTNAGELVRLAEVAFKIQQSVLGKVEEDKATVVHLHFRNIAEKPKAFEPKTIEGERS